MVSRASNIGASEDHERTASTPGEHHCASVGTDTPGSWAGEVREFQATTVITRPGVLRLIIHIMLVGALPYNAVLIQKSDSPMVWWMLFELHGIDRAGLLTHAHTRCHNITRCH